MRTLVAVGALLCVGIAPPPVSAAPDGAPVSVAAPASFAETVRLGGPGVRKPTVAMTDRGSTVVVWERSNSQRHQIQAVVRRPRGVWGEVETLARWRPTRRNDYYAGAPAVVEVAKGRLLVAWSNKNFRIVHRVWTPAGGFGATRPVSRKGAMAITPLAAANSDGQVAISWLQRLSGGAYATTAGVRRDGSWLVERLGTQIRAARLKPGSPIVVSESGEVSLAWFEYPGDGRARASRLAPGATRWEKPRVFKSVVSADPDNCGDDRGCWPAIGVDREGRAYLSDHYKESGGRNWVRNADGVWTRDSRVPYWPAAQPWRSTDAGELLTLGKVARDQMVDSDAPFVRQPDGSWEAGVFAGDEVAHDLRELVVNDAGHGAVIADRDDVGIGISRRGPGNTWTAMETIAEEPPDVDFRVPQGWSVGGPTAAVDAEGMATFVWLSKRRGQPLRLHAARFDTSY